ncbi:MAG TPA: glycosyltransferase family 1 protein [Propionicimonas sp.]|nr:glycosyltransferase family 1 protein [Propionicimonas sp.]
MTTPVVAVDLLFMTGQRGGTETYLRSLMPFVRAEWPQAQWIGIGGRHVPAGVTDWFPGRIHRAPIDTRSSAGWAAAELALEPVARRQGAQLIWSPANFGPRATKLPFALTLHDTTPFELPSPANPLVRTVTTTLMRMAARSADQIITESEDAARRIHRILGIPTDRITVALPGATPRGEPGDIDQVLAAHRIRRDRPIVLSTSGRLPHKNLGVLLRAVAAMPVAERPTLVITGGGDQDPLAGEVAALGLGDQVVLPGWLSRGDLEAIFDAADVYCTTTLAEGFGFPLLDAMVRGKPVVASDIEVLHEVAGDAAVYADPNDPQDVARQLGRLLADPGLAKTLAERGSARAGEFSWTVAAETTVSALQRARRGR